MIIIEEMKVETHGEEGNTSLTIQIHVPHLRSHCYAAWVAGQITGAILQSGFCPPKEITTNFGEDAK